MEKCSKNSTVESLMEVDFFNTCCRGNRVKVWGLKSMLHCDKYNTTIEQTFEGIIVKDLKSEEEHYEIIIFKSTGCTSYNGNSPQHL